MHTQALLLCLQIHFVFIIALKNVRTLEQKTNVNFRRIKRRVELIFWSIEELNLDYFIQ